MDLNKVMIIGRLTRDPELRATTTGMNVCNMGVATGYSYTNKQTGQKVEQTEFHNVVLFGKLGEIAKVVLVRVDGAPSPFIPSEQHRNKKGESRDPLNKKHITTIAKPTNYYALIVLPAGKYVDFSGIKKALKAKKVSMASEKDIIKNLKTKVGLLHPFGSQYNMKTLLDKGLAKSKKLMASAGSYSHSVEISMKDFEKLVNPIKGTFAKKNK